MDLFKSRKSQKGQILLIVVLAAVVSLTVGLSAVSRTITNTSVTTEEASSQKALSAAEAGIEQLVKQDNPVPLASNLSNKSGFNAKVDKIDGREISVNGGGEVLKDDGADIWLTTYPNFGGTPWGPTGANLDVFWNDNKGCGASGTDVNPAIEVVVISGASKNSPNMSRAVFDACSRGNGFSPPTFDATRIDGKDYNHGLRIAVTNGYIARVIPLYANAVIGARGSVAFPTQGYVIDSVGSAGNTKRTVRVFKGYPKVPIEYFPYNVFLP